MVRQPDTPHNLTHPRLLQVSRQVERGHLKRVPHAQRRRRLLAYLLPLPSSVPRRVVLPESSSPVGRRPQGNHVCVVGKLRGVVAQKDLKVLHHILVCRLAAVFRVPLVSSCHLRRGRGRGRSRFLQRHRRHGPGRHQGVQHHQRQRVRRKPLLRGGLCSRRRCRRSRSVAAATTRAADARPGRPRLDHQREAAQERVACVVEAEQRGVHTAEAAQRDVDRHAAARQPSALHGPGHDGHPGSERELQSSRWQAQSGVVGGATASPCTPRFLLVDKQLVQLPQSGALLVSVHRLCSGGRAAGRGSRRRRLRQTQPQIHVETFLPDGARCRASEQTQHAAAAVLLPHAPHPLLHEPPHLLRHSPRVRVSAQPRTRRAPEHACLPPHDSRRRPLAARRRRHRRRARARLRHLPPRPLLRRPAHT
eukprot:Rhum_TRINITY_DN14261_c17_g1::Rhum_TRINITY_DN14261_c17_g1_i1::g.77698::m.77698